MANIGVNTPQAIVETEYAVIGCAMQDRICCQAVSALPEDAFSTVMTQSIHRAIKRLVSKGDTVDLISLCEQCRVEIAEPEKPLMHALDIGFLTTAYKTYEGMLMECRRKRIVGSAARSAVQQIVQPGANVDAICSQLENAVHDMGGQNETVNAEQAMGMMVDSITHSNDGRCYSGIAGLDNMTGGFRGGKLVVLGARPGVGKTALALSIARSVWENTGRVLIVSLEMDEAEIMTRIVASYTGIDCQRLQAGKVSPSELAQVSAVLDNMGPHRFDIATRASTPLQIRRIASQMKFSKEGLAMIIVDYLQLMRTDSKRGTRYEQVSEISRELKLMASDFKIPVLAMTQFNRESEQFNQGGQRKPPTMAQAKDSGSIEQDANMFLIQWPVPEPMEANSATWNAWHWCKVNGLEYQMLIVAKNRQGKTGIVDMGFDKPHMQFRMLEDAG